jgi:hypothetical protein
MYLLSFNMLGPSFRGLGMPLTWGGYEACSQTFFSSLEPEELELSRELLRTLEYQK